MEKRFIKLEDGIIRTARDTRALQQKRKSGMEGRRVGGREREKPDSDITTVAGQAMSLHAHFGAHEPRSPGACASSYPRSTEEREVDQNLARAPTSTKVFWTLGKTRGLKRISDG